MALTAERRVLEAELSTRLNDLRSGRHRLSYVVVFESYEDYLEWKDKDEAGIL